LSAQNLSHKTRLSFYPAKICTAALAPVRVQLRHNAPAKIQINLESNIPCVKNLLKSLEDNRKMLIFDLRLKILSLETKK
jgi:hypothetical protein